MGQLRTGGRQGGVTEAALRQVDVAGVEELPEGTMLMVQVDGTDILVIHREGRFHAVQGICSHQYFELDKGFLTGGSITCALHMSRFDLATGEALDPPAEVPLATFGVDVLDGRILLTLPEGPIPINE